MENRRRDPIAVANANNAPSGSTMRTESQTILIEPELGGGLGGRGAGGTPRRREAASVRRRPPLRLLRVMTIWRARFAEHHRSIGGGLGLMEALSYPWRKMGVVGRPEPPTSFHDEIKANSPPMPSFVEACEQCHEDVIRYLLRKPIGKAELNARDKTGKTGLSHACCNGFVSIVNLLRLPEIDVTLADNEGNHPLIFAAQAGHADIVSILINYFPGLNLDQPNQQGFTALMKAAVQGRARCAKLLLYAGATPFARDCGRGLCALEWAEYCGRHSTAKVIAQFVEACNLGLMCSTILANSRPSVCSQQSQQRNHSTASSTSTGTNHNQLDLSSPSVHRNWRSDSCLTSNGRAIDHHSDDATNNIGGCMPFQLLQRVRRSLPSSNAESNVAAAFSPLQSLEEIARMCYSPVFPEYVSPPASRKSSSIVAGSSASNRRSHLLIPKVEITMTSKDDNYFYETQLPFARSPVVVYRKYADNMENTTCHSDGDKGV